MRKKTKKRSSDLFKSVVSCWDCIASVADEVLYGALVEWYWRGKIKVRTQKPVQVLLCLPQPMRRLFTYRTRTSAVKGCWQTAWARQTKKEGKEQNGVAEEQ
jgi:hypothetical protein